MPPERAATASDKSLLLLFYRKEDFSFYLSTHIGGSTETIKLGPADLAGAAVAACGGGDFVCAPGAGISISGALAGRDGVYRAGIQAGLHWKSVRPRVEPGPDRDVDATGLHGGAGGVL